MILQSSPSVFSLGNTFNPLREPATAILTLKMHTDIRLQQVKIGAFSLY